MGRNGKIKTVEEWKGRGKTKGELYRNIQGEVWKMRHTLLPWLHVLIPLLGILVFLSYYSFASWSDEGKVSGYIEALSIVLPLMVSIVCAISVEIEEKVHFQTFLGVTASRGNPMLAKWMILSGMGFAAILLSVFGFAAGFWLLCGKAVLSAGNYLTLAVALTLGGTNLYLFHLFLNLAFSKSVSLCAGTTELVVAALFLTGLGEGRWQFFPCAWGGRWSMSLIQYWKGDGAAMKSMPENLSVGVIVTILLWCGVLLWFRHYEGRPCKD